MPMSIGNVAIWVNDLERSTAFYRDGLGLDVIATVHSGDIHEVIVGRQAEGSQLMLAHRDGDDAIGAPAGFWKVFLATDDLAGDYARAINAGAAPVTEPTRIEQFNITIAIVADPDGYLLELGQISPS